MTYMFNKLKLQVSIARPGTFTLNKSRLGGDDLLGSTTKINNTWVLGQSKLGVDWLGVENQDVNEQWDDVTQWITSIKVSRGAEPTDTGSATKTGVMNVTFAGARMDPNINASLRFGVTVRLITTAGVPVFTGTFLKSVTTHEKPEGSKETTFVTMTVVDRGYQLANVKRYGIIASSFGERVESLVTKHNIPFVRVGTVGKNLARTDYEASLMSHLQLATDSEDGWWYIDRAGVVRVGNTAPVTTGAPVFSSWRGGSYTELNESYDPTDIVNELTISNRTWGTNSQGEEEGVTTDYVSRNLTSVATHGSVAGSVETNLASTADVTALSDTLLARYSTPTNRVSRLTFNATETGGTTLEPYSVIAYEFRNQYYDRKDFLKVLRVSETITPERWLVDLELGKI